jgi:Erv1 / Alr family
MRLDQTLKSIFIYQMRLPPTVWGPFFWHTIHITALGYPNDPNYTQKRSAKEFFEALGNLIPCPVCRNHYAVHIQKFPISPHLDKRVDLFRWTVQLHNEVNKSLGKAVLTETEVIYYYKRLGARERSPVINQEYLDEVDIRSMLKGGFVGAGITFLAGSLLWWTTKTEK